MFIVITVQIALTIFFLHTKKNTTSEELRRVFGDLVSNKITKYSPPFFTIRNKLI